ncbi:MAG: hypothetical protein AAF492_11790, partial [Verrucomicrobiota bacterium]
MQIVRFLFVFTLFFAFTNASKATSVTNGMVLWLNAQTIGSNHNDTVGFWPDDSGQNHPVDNHAQTPTYVTNGLNGQPVVRFDGGGGAADFMWSTYNFDPHLTYTILSVARYTGTDHERVVSSNTRNWLFGYHGNLDERFYAEGWIHTTGSNNNDWHLHAGTVTNAADPLASFWKDGVLLTQNDAGSGNGNHTIGQLSLGGWRANNELSQCEIAEVLIYDRVLSPAELNEVGAYLEMKYGLNTTYFDPNLPEVVPLNAARVNMADDITTSNVTVFGSVVTTGAAPAGAYLVYGTNDPGAVVNGWDASSPIFGGLSLGTVSNSLTNLTAGTKYFFRYVSTNAFGTNVTGGTPGVFITATTGAPPLVVTSGLVVRLDASRLNLT